MKVALAESDVRTLVRLLGEAASVERTLVEKKSFLMNGLCEIIKADAWGWTLSCQLEPGAPQTYVWVLQGGLTETRLAKLLLAIEHPQMSRPVARFNERLLASNECVVMQRTEIDPDNLAHSAELDRLWSDANIGPLMMGGYRVDTRSASCIGIYRPLDAANFTLREMKIAQIVLGEVKWLHLSGWPEVKGALIPTLYPRQRTVLNCLLDGMARKQIAHLLDISPHTVSGYCKDIYRHFGVNSQPELMKKYLHGLTR